MDASILTTSIAAARATVDVIKSSIEISKSLDKAELTQKLLDAQMGTIDLMGRVTELINENNRISMENRTLNEKLNDLGRIETHHQVYWKRNGDGSIDGPFDTEEYDKNKILLRLKAKTRTYLIGKENEIVIQYQKGHDRLHPIYIPLKFLMDNGFNENNLPSE
jgi:regulator of replication initiation timing